MLSGFSALAMIAENRIREAVDRGDFDNLPGQGQALRIEDLSHVPEELRMAYKILKNSNYLPPELERRREIGKLADLMDACPCEKEKVRHMRKLRFLLQKLDMEKSSFSPAWDDEYYTKILARLEASERKLKNEGTDQAGC